VSVQANKEIFRHYRSGVIDYPTCGTEVGHAVLAIGYGFDRATGQDYVIIKNSWGEWWGDKGFGRISLSQQHSPKGVCGVLTDGFYGEITD